MIRRTVAWVLGTAATILSVRALRPLLTCWGATDAEVRGPFPGGEVVVGGVRSGTMAVTLDGPPERVWPWLVQMGWDRAGWYSWDLLDNAGRPSARAVHPEWQDLAVGDRLRYWLPFVGPVDSYEIGVLEPGRFLGLYGLTDLRGRWLDAEQPRPAAYIEGLWGFDLRELSGGRTRLVISGYQAARPRWVERVLYGWLFPPVVWIMQARMMAVLRRNVAQTEGSRDPAVASGS